MMANVEQLKRHANGLRFSTDEANAAGEEWGFNCGPGALCAVFYMTPDEVRPFLGNFERKGYTNPTLMRQILTELRARFVWRTLSKMDQNVSCLKDWAGWPRLGLCRIQWHGSWCDDGVPIRARYRHTHWIGHRVNDKGHQEVYDVNGTCVGWMPFNEWKEDLVPWLLPQVESKSTGIWWLTHVAEITE